MAEGSNTPVLLPDLLKNTPSNIARLEDVVRWYFCKTSLAPNDHFLMIDSKDINGLGSYFDGISIAITTVNSNY
ncbi:hypothetical protein MTR_1g105770 [Medicago truncatula]|uniref:Uncharacterized protein n=1 Tax=Medicago truncatula TaxID=3880 RepID=G8A0U5_MEDTR|nr:hypothetical protein MTR_1g105770 [Medicago truncatula]